MYSKLIVGRYIDFIPPAPSLAAIKSASDGFERVNPLVFHMMQSSSEASTHKSLNQANATKAPSAGLSNGQKDSRFKVMREHIQQHVTQRNQTSQITFTPHTTKEHRNFIWLPYIPGKVTEVKQNGMDVFTGPLSGCWVTTYFRNNERYVGHVGTFDDAYHPESIAAKKAWNDYITRKLNYDPSEANNIKGIRTSNYSGAFPKADHSKGDSGAFFYALVTPENRFYIVMLYQHIRNYGRYRIVLIDEMLGEADLAHGYKGGLSADRKIATPPKPTDDI